jgi:hypothetical protein
LISADTFGKRFAMASATAITLAAIRSDAASIILPSSEAAPLPSASAFAQRLDDAPGARDFRLGRREHLVGKFDLAWVDGPLAF